MSLLPSVMLFASELACFSPSVPKSTKKAWVLDGGTVVKTVQQFKTADYHFCAGLKDPWLTELRSRSLVVFQADWVTSSVKAGSKVPVAPYVLDDDYVPPYDSPSIATPNLLSSSSLQGSTLEATPSKAAKRSLQSAVNDLHYDLSNPHPAKKLCLEPTHLNFVTTPSNMTTIPPPVSSSDSAATLCPSPLIYSAPFHTTDSFSPSCNDPDIDNSFFLKKQQHFLQREETEIVSTESWSPFTVPQTLQFVKILASSGFISSSTPKQLQDPSPSSNRLRKPDKDNPIVYPLKKTVVLANIPGDPRTADNFSLRAIEASRQFWEAAFVRMNDEPIVEPTDETSVPPFLRVDISQLIKVPLPGTCKLIKPEEEFLGKTFHVFKKRDTTNIGNDSSVATIDVSGIWEQSSTLG